MATECLHQILQTSRGIAATLPTGAGVIDSEAVTKCRDEQAELQEKLERGDALGAVLEVADVAYYAAKAVFVGEFSYTQAWEIITDACVAGGVLPDLLPGVLLAKYAGRMQGLGKKDGPERERVRLFLESKGVVIVSSVVEV